MQTNKLQSEEKIQIPHRLSSKTIEILTWKVTHEIEELQHTFDNELTRRFLLKNLNIFPQRWQTLNEEVYNYISDKLKKIGYTLDLNYRKHSQIICFGDLKNHSDEILWIHTPTLFIPFSFPDNQKGLFSHEEMEWKLTLNVWDMILFDHNKSHALEIKVDPEKSLWYGLILYIKKYPSIS